MSAGSNAARRMGFARRRRRLLGPVRSLLLSAALLSSSSTAPGAVRAQDQEDEGEEPLTLATCNVAGGTKCWCVPTLKDGITPNLSGRCIDPTMRKHRNIKKNVPDLVNASNPRQRRKFAKQAKNKAKKFRSAKYECLSEERYSLEGCNPFDADASAADCPKPPGHDYEKPVCGVIYRDAPQRGKAKCITGRRYGLRTFESYQALRAHPSAVLTHTGHCGVCSNLRDLSVFLGQPKASQDLAGCAEDIMAGTAGVARCYEDLGLTPDCAALWANSLSAAVSSCLFECLQVLNDPGALLNDPDTCAKHPCIVCRDEATLDAMLMYGGRDFVNSALRTAMIEPCGKLRRAKFVGHNPCHKKFDGELPCGGGGGAPVDTRKAGDNIFGDRSDSLRRRAKN